jgi:diguanylate cyclase (GGDEF)-like protein
MPDEHEHLLEAIYEIAAAETEAVCLTRIEEYARALFGQYEPVLVTGQRAGRAGRRFELIASGQVIAQLVTGPVPDDVAHTIETFAAHAALALYQTRRLDDHQHRSRHDALTGLHNRREFREALSRELPRGVQSSRRLALIIIDLNRFKEVNDQHGHAAGDRLLRRVAAAISAHRRPSDSGFRIGGDEFAVLLRGVDRAEATVVAERAVSAIAHLAGSHGASWGVAVAPIDTTNADQLLLIADADMYRRKRGHAPLGHASDRSAKPDDDRPPHRHTHGARRSGRHHRCRRRRTPHDVRLLSRGHPTTRRRRAAGDRRSGPARPGRLALPGLGAVHPGRRQWTLARTAQIAVVPDTHLDPAYLAYERNQDPGSEVSVPLVLDARVWGVLNVEQIATHAFDESDVLLLEAVAVITTSAIAATAHNQPNRSTDS